MKFIHLADFKKKQEQKIEPAPAVEQPVTETPEPVSEQVVVAEQMKMIDEKIEHDTHVEDSIPETPEVLEGQEVIALSSDQVLGIEEVDAIPEGAVFVDSVLINEPLTVGQKTEAIESTIADYAMKNKDESLIQLLCEYAKVLREDVEKAYEEGKSLSEITGKTVILI